MMSSADKDGVAKLFGADGSTQWQPIHTEALILVIPPQPPLQLEERAKKNISRLVEEGV